MVGGFGAPYAEKTHIAEHMSPRLGRAVLLAVVGLGTFPGEAYSGAAPLGPWVPMAVEVTQQPVAPVLGHAQMGERAELARSRGLELCHAVSFRGLIVEDGQLDRDHFIFILYGWHRGLTSNFKSVRSQFRIIVIIRSSWRLRRGDMIPTGERNQGGIRDQRASSDSSAGKLFRGYQVINRADAQR